MNLVRMLLESSAAVFASSRVMDSSLVGAKGSASREPS